jgi:hypothetical protein
VGWEQLAEAAYALATPEDAGGIPWIATNTDWTIPQARGIAPGNGTLVSAVHTAVGRLAVVAGKPERPIFDEAVARFAAHKALFIGDRLDTDIAGAQAAGLDSVLVLTGIDRPKHVLAAPPTARPTFILGDLRELHEEYPETVVQGEVTSVRDAAVRIDGADIHVVSEGPGRSISYARAPQPSGPPGAPSTGSACPSGCTRIPSTARELLFSLTAPRRPVHARGKSSTRRPRAAKKLGV